MNNKKISLDLTYRLFVVLYAVFTTISVIILFLEHKKLNFSYLDIIIICFNIIVSTFGLLINFVSDNVIKKLTSKKANSRNVQDVTIIGLFFRKKMQSHLLAYFILFFVIAIYLLLNKIFSMTYSSYFILILSCFTLILFINQKVIEYRVNKGFYGTNEHEAREIIRFIIKHSKDFDNFTGLKIFPDPKSYENLIITGVVEGAEAK